MTTVRFRFTVPAPGTPAADWVPADEAPASGAVSIRPWRPGDGGRRHVEAPDRTILPAPFSAELVAGSVTVALDPTGADWCYEVREQVHKGTVRYVAVPAALTVIEYGDLTDIDPATLLPSAAPTAAWWALWGAMAAGTYLVPDPAHTGLYLPTAGTSMTSDPVHAGLYMIGV